MTQSQTECVVQALCAEHSPIFTCDNGHGVCIPDIAGIVVHADYFSDVHCPVPECSADYDLFALLKVVPRECAMRLIVLRDSDREAKLLESVPSQDESTSDAVAFHVQYITTNILTDKCPRCGQAFVDFTGCIAVTCSRSSCQTRFCVQCLRTSCYCGHMYISQSEYERKRHARRARLIADYNRVVLDKIPSVKAQVYERVQLIEAVPTTQPRPTPFTVQPRPTPLTVQPRPTPLSNCARMTLSLFIVLFFLYSTYPVVELYSVCAKLWLPFANALRSLVLSGATILREGITHVDKNPFVQEVKSSCLQPTLNELDEELNPILTMSLLIIKPIMLLTIVLIRAILACGRIVTCTTSECVVDVLVNQSIGAIVDVNMTIHDCISLLAQL